MSVLGKQRKVQNLFGPTRRRSQKNWQRRKWEYYNSFLQNKIIDSARFMASSLSNLVNNLAEAIHKIKCKDYDCFLNMKYSSTI